MPSNFLTFDVLIDNDDGTATPVGSQTVKVYDVTHATALADKASDANGVVAGGTLPVAAGTLIRFSVSRADGLNGCAEQVTT